MPRETGERTKSVVTLEGEKLYLRRARAALSVLVRQAKAAQPVTYAHLAGELGIPNPRNLNYPLGAIGNAMRALGKAWNETIPPIQSLVVNQTTGVPGEGFSWFAPNAQEFRKASARRRRQIVDGMLAKVYDYKRWDAVLNHFHLKPSRATTRKEWMGRRRPGAEESHEHRRLKSYIAQNPHVVDLPASFGPGVTEFSFGSGDEIDVLFQGRTEWVGVEVKSAISDVADLVRGMYQCIKYQALMEATQRVSQVPPSARVLLALEKRFPPELVPLRNVLGVVVREGVKPVR